MAGKKTQAQLTPEEKLQQALVPTAEQPYKVPDNWCYFFFTALIDIEGGTQPPKSQFVDEPLENYVRLVQIRDFASNKYAVYVPDSKKLRHFENNDILIARYGASLGRICTGMSGVYNVALAKIIFSENILNRKYVYWMLQSDVFQIPLLSISRTAQAGFNKDDLSTFSMPLPPLVEQQRIVERIESLFAKLDEAKENLQNVLDGFETRKAAILHKAFTGELTANWRKQHGVSMESWVITTLKDVCLKITDGTHNSPVNTPIGEYMYITAKNIKETGVDLSNITFVSKDVHNEIYSRCDVQYGDVLYIKDGATTGIATVNNIEIPFSLLSSVAVLRPNKKIILAKYMAYNLNSSEVKSMMINNMSGNAITRLTLTKIKAAIIKICSLEEQAEIVRIIDDLLAKELQAKELAENALAKIDLIKKSILARAFRGKLGTNNPADEPAVELLKRML